MVLSAIVAMSENRVIGKNNQLPWHLPADLKHFKEITMGKTILMGRKTFESIGRPLPGRKNIVITRDPSFQAPGCIIIHSIENAIAAVDNEQEIFVIGGADLFKQMLPQVQKIYLTVIHQNFEGDTFFPNLDSKEWREVERNDFSVDSKNPFSYSFITLNRIHKSIK